tara:strand:- start:1869 stop:2066 length:198 start_codon:yes stop_codon:yes gene_type:complete
MAKTKYKTVHDFIEELVGKNERYDMIGENEWERIDDNIIRARKEKKITPEQMRKFRRQLKKERNI